MTALAHSAGASHAGAADARSLSGLSPARTTGLAVPADRSAVTPRPGRTMRSWPLLVLAAPAAAGVWSGWAGIAQQTGFGRVSPLPGIWPTLHLDTAITLPVGVEAYAACALRAWLASDHAVSARTRRFAKWSAICSFALGMAGQVAYHLLAQAGVTRAPWSITTIVSCLPVLVLAMGTALAHMLRADAAAHASDSGTARPATHWSPDRSSGNQARLDRDQGTDGGAAVRSGPPADTRRSARPGLDADVRTTARDHRTARPDMDQARLVARRLAAAGMPVSRRTLRSNEVRGSNTWLGALARTLNAELAGAAAGKRTGPPG